MHANVHTPAHIRIHARARPNSHAQAQAQQTHKHMRKSPRRPLFATPTRMTARGTSWHVSATAAPPDARVGKRGVTRDRAWKHAPSTLSQLKSYKSIPEHM